MCFNQYERCRCSCEQVNDLNSGQTHLLIISFLRYMVHVTALRKNEESLRRLRMGKRSGFSFFGSASSTSDEDSRDEERIRAQLILDVEAFGKDAGSLGVDIDQSAAYKALNYMVHTTPSSDAGPS